MTLTEHGSTKPVSTTPESATPHLDVIIVGAGLSGVGAAYRLKETHPERTFAILEARSAIGGTWDLFRYPGVRSDSDMYTLGYPFKPWTSEKMIGSGADIRQYVADTAREFDIERHIQFNTKVANAEWSSETQRWTLTTTQDGEPHTVTCNFLYLCAGYYSYDQPHDAQIPGIADFQGTIVHPQFWPEDLDYRGKKVVIIGSGATAVTIVPAMAEGGASKVTMLQRTPTYMTVLPSVDPLASAMRTRLPAKVADKINRLKSVAGNSLLYQLARRRPERVRNLLRGILEKSLKDHSLIEQHFTPSYDPWDQRLCLVPDGDLFREINNGRAEVVTDHIEHVTETGIQLTSGATIDADIIVTATGLQLALAGGIELSVDGEKVDPATRWLYRGLMLSGVPNAAICFGYINASWTLRADLSSRYVCRLLAHMDEHEYAVATPVEQRGVQRRPMLDLNSGYVNRSAHLLPAAGDSGVWRMRQNYALDRLHMQRADLGAHMQFTARRQAPRPSPSFSN